MSGYVGLRQGKVHESHVMSEYYCGGCGWPVTDHDSYCPECGGALKTASARDFDAEVAKLRAERDEWRRVAEAKQDIIDHMRDARAENAKLRGLVQKMMRFMEDGDWCDTCEVAKECDAQEQYEEDCLMRGVFRGCMRELGVEVDE